MLWRTLTKICLVHLHSRSVFTSKMSANGVSCLVNMQFLTNEAVRMKNRSYVESVLIKLKEGGRNKLQVIVDFDRTLTVPFVNGKECLTSFAILNLVPQLKSATDYTEKNRELFNFYRTIEKDPNLSIEEKSVHMEAWLVKKSAILQFELDKNEIDIAVAKANVKLREHTDAMFQLCRDNNIPLLVFSAGLGDTVQSVLKHEKVLHPNVHVISNFLNFDGTRVCGLQGQHIHTFNKNERAIRNTDYFNDLQGKENVLLLGDSLGDASMADGVKDLNAVLKIGFLSEKVEEYLPSFMEFFDIVLINDDTMNVANEILKNVI